MNHESNAPATTAGKKNRARRAAGAAALGLLVLGGVVISRPMLSSAAEAPAAGKLQRYEQPVADSLTKLKMLPVPGGTITIRGKSVTIKPFWIASTETPWEAFDVFTRSGPPSPAYDQTEFKPDAIARPSRSYILPDLGWGHKGYPVINVSITNVTMFCRWLSSTSKKKYRLPTEAEWELACRAGASGPWKLSQAETEKNAWYADNSNGTTHPVGKKAPNAYGLFDMLGNAGEWATDLSGKPVLCGGAFSDPLADQSPATRKYQTPKWQETDPQLPKSRWWLADGNFVGFRVVCEP